VAAVNRYVAIYLNDHLAGATLGVELVRRAVREHGSTELGPFLRELAVEIESDYAALRRLLRDFGVSEQRAKVAAGWAAEKIGRLKPNGHVVKRSPLTPLLELEALRAGVFGKRQLWVALAEMPLPEDARSRLEELTARADRQLEAIEDRRRRVAAAVGSG
jgi:hypothetical protein